MDVIIVEYINNHYIFHKAGKWSIYSFSSKNIEKKTIVEKVLNLQTPFYIWFINQKEIALFKDKHAENSGDKQENDGWWFQKVAPGKEGLLEQPRGLLLPMYLPFGVIALLWTLYLWDRPLDVFNI